MPRYPLRRPTLSWNPPDGQNSKGGAEAMRKLQPEHNQFHKELDRLLQVLAAQRRLMAREAGSSSTLATDAGETAEAQLVFAAQQRLKFRTRHQG
jgi:hypothetical protein